nr:VP4 [African horse sickness virus]
MEPYAILYVTQEIEYLLKDSFLPKWELDGIRDLNTLWLERGRMACDTYAVGKIDQWSVRQLRAHRFLFISTKRKIRLKDCTISPDIFILKKELREYDMKKFETLIGRRRVTLRKSFGNMLRAYAFQHVTVLHGSEAETLSYADPKRHVVKGQPKAAPMYDHPDKWWRDVDDGPTDKKLVSMLDYIIYSADEVYYVGCGDLKTLEQFASRDRKRFDRIKWICIDPIAPEISYANVKIVKEKVVSARDLKHYLMRDEVERLLIWDVSADGLKGTIEWEKQRFKEDRNGENIAEALCTDFALALIKHRIPEESDEYICRSSWLLPQPGAPITMYELRNLMRLDGFSHVERKHIPRAYVRKIDAEVARRLVEEYHGEDVGRLLKRSLYEDIHIERADGLTDGDERTRADLFYLTNMRNAAFMHDVYRVVEKSFISTLWVSSRQNFTYDDVPVNRNFITLRFSKKNRRVLDGNGAILFLMWQHPKDFPKTTNYDPSWAENYAVIFYHALTNPVPDLSLCRFIGLRLMSSTLRINSDRAHQVTDILKKLGLDVSGHLFICLMSNSYVADLDWWFRMILEWSVKDREGKLAALSEAKAELIEWKDEKADEPWHIKNDLLAALFEFMYFAKHFEINERYVESWIQYLRNA